jgi:hypothetical protein
VGITAATGHTGNFLHNGYWIELAGSNSFVIHLLVAPVADDTFSVMWNVIR